MNDIGIVTAFFDIGRGNWTPDKGLPHYLQRTTDTYFERFAHLAKLDNEMVVYTSEDLAPKIKELRGNKTTHINVVDFKTSFEDLRNMITKTQENPDFRKHINPTQIKNPEYWNADYVLVNLLKASFARRAITMNQFESDMVAWLDFGYCRDESTLNGVTKWQYPFNKEKIHLFNIKDYVEGTFISDIIFNNDVHMTGPCIVASKDNWTVMENLVQNNTRELLKNNLIDDDQTLLLMAYLSAKELFELHSVSPSDWFVAFRKFNENIS